MTEAMAKKVAIGNAELVRKFCLAGLPFWIENPAGSFLWLQPAWVALQAEFGLQSFLTDYCRWGTPRRKRAKFLDVFGTLVGYSSAHGCCWTKAAEAYPRSLARYLAASVAEDLKPPQRRRFVDPGVMARCGRGGIGEAANPGPRRGRTRPEVDLEEVTLVTLVFLIGCTTNFHKRIGSLSAVPHAYK